jgi:hypothetical protein
VLSHHPTYIPHAKGLEPRFAIYRSYYTYASSSYKFLSIVELQRNRHYARFQYVYIILFYLYLSPPFFFQSVSTFIVLPYSLQSHPSFLLYFCVYVILILKSMLTLYVLQTWVVISPQTKRTSASTNNTPSDPERAISKRRGH